MSVNGQNQIVGYCYDPAGNLLDPDACPSGNTPHTYAYNAEGQMVSALAGAYNYTYDGDGRRVEKSGGKLYWYGVNGEVLTETDLSGNLTDDYVFFGGNRLARVDAAGNANYYLSDQLGSSRVVTDSNGNLLDDCDFYPFGWNRCIASGSGNTYKFTGKERDYESNLDYFGARYNASSIGRFMTPDPFTLSPLHIINPQRWNMYAYSLNNPTTLVDPTGLSAIAVNFQKEVPGGGHEGFISIHDDGRAEYARFGPVGGGALSGPGEVDVYPLSRVQMGPNGLPTDAGYKQLAAEVAKDEKQDPSTVRMNFFITSELDTNAADAWIQRMKEASDKGGLLRTSSIAKTVRHSVSRD